MIFMSKFDLIKEISEYKCPDMFIAGLKHYIQSNNIEIKNKKELDKIVKEYANLKIGG